MCIKVTDFKSCNAPQTNNNYFMTALLLISYLHKFIISKIPKILHTAVKLIEFYEIQYNTK